MEIIFTVVLFAAELLLVETARRVRPQQERDVVEFVLSLFPTARRSSTDKAHNVSEMFIANPEENCEGKYIKVTAEPNGTFTVLNSRNNFKKTYTK